MKRSLKFSAPSRGGLRVPGWGFFSRSVERRIGAILLVLVVLVAAEVAGVVLLVREQGYDARTVALSGRQAVLTQRIAKHAASIGSDDLAAGALQSAAADFEQTLAELRDGNEARGIPPASGSIRPAIVALTPDWQVMRTNIDRLLSPTTESAQREQARSTVITRSEALLAKTNTLSGLLVAQSDQKTQQLLAFLFAMAGAAIVVFLLAIIVVRRTVIRRVRDLATVAQRVQSGDMRARAPSLGHDELGGVAASLNTMLDEITTLVQTREERDALQQQIIKLLDEVSDVAQGDLTVQAEVTAGTLGSVADAFNYMIEELRSIIENVNRTATEVTASTERIVAASSQLAVQAESQAQRIMQATHAVDELSDVADTVARNASKGAQIAVEARQSAAEGAEAVKLTVEGMNRIRAQVQDTSKKIKRLGESSQEIGQIVQLIQEIADQTNLLALNAAIQAAMAGEHGRGFAVVADEVRRLAERASVATKQISSLINTIQAETTEAVLAMENGTREVVDGSQLANAAGQNLESINAVVDQLSALIEEISEAAAREAQASAGIREAMVEISQTTTSSAAGTRQAAESVGYLARLSEQLQRSVSAFRLAKEDGAAASAA